MNLSEHFTLDEAIKSSTALRLGIDNTPDHGTIDRMKLVCVSVLEPLRAHFQKPISVNSFYRSPRLNAEVGSKPNSQHVSGEAVDIEVSGIPNAEVAAYIKDHLPFDQCILEFYTPGKPNSGWVHVSYKADGCRAQCLTINSSGTQQGFIA